MGKLEFIALSYVILSEAAVGGEVEESFIFRCISVVIGLKILRLASLAQDDKLLGCAINCNLKLIDISILRALIFSVKVDIFRKQE